MSRASEMLKRARLEAGLTQAQLSARSGQPISVISAYENGRRQPLADTLLELLEAAGTEVEVRNTVAASRRAARQLESVCALAMELPRRPAGELTFPSLRQMAASR